MLYTSAIFFSFSFDQNLLRDDLHVEEGGVVGNVLEVLGIEPPPGLSVTHPDDQRN